MHTFQRTTISSEISDLLHEHIDELSQFGIKASISFQDELEGITDKVTSLINLTKLQPAQVAVEQIQTATKLVQFLDSFLRAINARQIFTDPSTEIGQIYQHIRSWYDVALQHHSLPVETVWKMIEPVQPDTLNVLGGNLFEAYWWDPVPRMDLEILKRTPGIAIIEGPYVPKSMSAGIGLRFTIHEVETT